MLKTTTTMRKISDVAMKRRMLIFFPCTQLCTVVTQLGEGWVGFMSMQHSMLHKLFPLSIAQRGRHTSTHPHSAMHHSVLTHFLTLGLANCNETVREQTTSNGCTAQ